MTSVPIAFRTNTSKYQYLGQPELVNCYAEAQGSDTKAPLAVLPSYGMKLFSEVTDTPCRGLIYLPDLDVIYTVHSTSVYKVVEAGTSTRIGTLPGNDIVQMSRNQADPVQISIHSERGEFYIENDVVKRVTDEDLPEDVVSQDQIAGSTIYGIRDRRFFKSEISACQTIDGTDYATAEQSPGPLKRVKADGDLFLFKTDSVETWRNTGNADFPFEPFGRPIQKGLLATNAVIASDNTLMYPGHDRITYRIAGQSAQRISNHGIERAFQNDPSSADIIGFDHSAEGHSFATWSGSNFTRTYDAATKEWHSRSSFGMDHWRARFSVNAWGKTIVGDVLTGNLYELDKDTFAEGDDPMIWGVRSPVLQVFPNGGVVDAVHFDVATGVGVYTGQGSSPKMMFSWSTDGGKTFKGHRELSLGATGKNVRVTTRRLGKFGPKGIVFDIRISDPVIRALANVDVAVRPLKK